MGARHAVGRSPRSDESDVSITHLEVRRRWLGNPILLVNRQIRIPVVLWVAFCGLLCPKDQRSPAEAESCAYIFSIVLVRATGWKRKDRLHHRSATEVHCSGLKDN